MKPVNNTNFFIRMLNVRDEKVTKTEKQEQFARDIDKYNLDAFCFQETKIKDGLDVDIRVKKHKLVCVQSVSLNYGNGFVINKRWKRNTHRS